MMVMDAPNFMFGTEEQTASADNEILSCYRVLHRTDTLFHFLSAQQRTSGVVSLLLIFHQQK